MSLPTVNIEFLPSGKVIHVERGTALRDALEAAGIKLRLPCGGKGLCGKCKVIFEQGASPVTPTEDDRLTETELTQGYRLGCQTSVIEDSLVYIPDSVQGAKILTVGTARQVPLNPAVTKKYARVQPPDRDDLRSDLARLMDAFEIKESELELTVLQSLGKDLRAADFDVTAVFSGNRLVGIEAGDTTSDCCGVALDIGTTTIAAYLLDLNTGKQISVAAAMNPQAGVGDDVISRINYVMQEADGLKKLQSMVVSESNRLIKVLADGADVSAERIYEVTVAGNTCMTHLFLGIDPTYLAIAPYVPVINDSISVKADELGIGISPLGRVHILPTIAGYVGADTVGVILASGFYEQEKLTLAVDIGTNGEIVLGSDRRMLACSTAAGPAFEGAHIKHGMRAAPGAIDAVWFENGGIRYSTIAGADARGICGSGLLDAIICLIKAGIIEPSGRIVDAEELQGEYAHLSERIEAGERGNAFVLASAEEASIGGPVVISQRDVREVQLAKGAIAAGIQTLMEKLNVRPDDLDRIVLAGAFGNYLSKESAIQAGMIPDVPLSKVHAVGNAAGEGAKLALISLDARRDADGIAERIEYVELTTDPGFQERFADALMFGSEATVC